ncbi:MAG: MBOAT family protein [Saccharofermentans sp.]|nr:MBOAT family protein [Saccharofermentans sp.]
MVFSSTVFLFIFLPALLVVYHVVPRILKNYVLLAASIAFYAWGEPKNVFIMILSIVVNYILGLLVERFNKQKKVFLVLAVVYNLAMLFVFKYLNFSVGIINTIFRSNVQIAQIALPIGISFYTFQILSYVIDVYRGEVKAQKNFFHLALYVSLFPQLIAGPIVRYSDVEKQIVDRKVDLNKFREGAIRFCVGFSKKVLIADQVAGYVDQIFGGAYPSIISYWVGIIAYSLQIFFDFSGYSDMAIGLGKMFGFDFLENFDYPYISQSVQEFWRRWHISLSSWFRDYLYIPLGGNRKGTVRTYINLCIVFFMTGLWHGASFNFIVWGLFYAVFLVIERLGFKNVLAKLPRVIRHLYAILVAMFGWIFFRAETLTAALQYIKGMFVLQGKDFAKFVFVINPMYIFFIVVGIIFCMPHNKIKDLVNKHEATMIIADFVKVLVFALAISYMLGSGFSPFLYFRF